MTVYLAAAFLATVLMCMLHLSEWRTASTMAALLRSGSKPVVEVRRLHRAIRVEALYYLMILPYAYSTSSALPSRLLAVAAIYHWGGLAFGEGSGLFEKLASGGDAASGGSQIAAISAIAALDISEMVLLGWLLSILVGSLISSLAPVTAVTGIAVFQA